MDICVMGFYNIWQLDNANRRGDPGNPQVRGSGRNRPALCGRQLRAVLIANALHVMPEPEKALREIDRALRLGGILIAPNSMVCSTAIRSFPS